MEMKNFYKMAITPNLSLSSSKFRIEIVGKLDDNLQLEIIYVIFSE